MKKVELGIIIPVYNDEKYLRKCLDSVLNQTYRDFQLVLVDDGSTDSSGKICDEYSKNDDRVKVIHQKNMGMLPSRYVGVKAVDCEYVSFLDADDWIDQSTYDTVAEYMRESVDIISYDIIRWFDDDYQYITHSYTSSGFMNRKNIDNICTNMIWEKKNNSYGFEPSVCNKVFKYSILLDSIRRAKNAGILNYGQDLAISYPIMTEADTLMILDKPLYFHRQRPRNEVAYYIKDHNYFGELARLYNYLGERFEWDSNIIEQLDLFFAASVGYRMRMYDVSFISGRYKYMFPFGSIPAGSRIIVYGASEMGNAYVEQINRTGFAELVMQVDRNYLSLQKQGVQNPDRIKEIDDYDYIIIAATQKDTINSIVDILSNCDVPEEKIVRGLA